MGVYTFVVKGCDGDWSAKQLKGDLEASAASTFELQRKLVQAATAADSAGGVQSSFSFITPSSAVFQVIIGGGGGGGGGGFIGGGAAAAAAAPAGGAPAAEAAPAKEEKEEKEESEDEDFGMSLFD